MDFWLDPDAENMDRLVRVFQQMGFSIDDVPAEVRQQQQNISIKFSPEQPYIELITRFALGKSFDQAWKHSKTARLRTDEKITSRQVPDIDAIIKAHENGTHLPAGVRVVQNYQIRTKRNIESSNEN